MAKCVNKALLLGYAGKTPEIHSTAGGTLAASFSLATSERQQDRQGNWTDKTEWHNLVAFGRPSRTPGTQARAYSGPTDSARWRWWSGR